MISRKLEQLIWEGRAEFKTQTFGLGEQFFLNVDPKTFIIVTGFDFSPRAFSLNSGGQSGDAAFLLQQIILSDKRRSNTFLFKPFFQVMARGADEVYFTDLVQNHDLYLVFENQLSIFTTICTIEQISIGSDTLPANNLLRPNITAGGKDAITLVDNTITGERYAPLQEYGGELSLDTGTQRDLVIEKGTYTPVTTDASNFPFLTLQYVVCKFQIPSELQ